MYEKCAFTGHRILERDFDFNVLDRVIYNLIRGGTRYLYCGMATGVDMAAAESVLSHKKDFEISLIACIPCPEQDKSYSVKNKERYQRILENCSKVTVLSEEYFDGCMQARDRYLVDTCDVLLAYKRRNRGGTAYTVNYAKSKGVNVIEI